MSISTINEQIRKQICHTTISLLKDNNLMHLYQKCPSVKTKIRNLRAVLDTEINNESIKNEIIQNYLPDLIPPGTKGAIRGNILNAIVKKYIQNLHLDADLFSVCFEKNCPSHLVATSEIPDWYIHDVKNDRIIVGMNQLDLWTGGHQLNRGYKYIDNEKYNNKNCKLLCVVSSDIQFKSDNNKAFKLFQLGFQKERLCYLNNIENIINSFFSISTKIKKKQIQNKK